MSELPATNGEEREIEAGESTQKMDYPRLLLFQMNRIGFITSNTTPNENPAAVARAIEWAIGALEAMVAPYVDDAYKDAYDAAVIKKQEKMKIEGVDKIAVSVRFQMDKFAHIMKVCDRKGILLRHTYMDRIEPRILKFNKEKALKEEQENGIPEPV